MLFVPGSAILPVMTVMNIFSWVGFWGILASLPVSAAPVAPPVNTAGAAMQAVQDFLPGPGESKESLPSPAWPDLSRADLPWDAAAGSAAIDQALKTALAGLAAGQAEPYLAILDVGYTQAGPVTHFLSRSETEARLRDLLARNRCEPVKFGLLACRMDAPDRAVVTVWEQMTCSSRNTPPTQIKGQNGQVAIVNQTGRLTITLALRQEWVRRPEGWRLRSAQALKSKGSAVL